MPASKSPINLLRISYGVTDFTRFGLPGSTFSTDDAPHSSRGFRASTAAAPFAVLHRTTETPPSKSTSGWADRIPQKAPSVISEPHERLHGQEKHDGRSEALHRKARMYQSSSNTPPSQAGAPSYSACSCREATRSHAFPDTRPTFPREAARASRGR